MTDDIANAANFLLELIRGNFTFVDIFILPLAFLIIFFKDNTQDHVRINDIYMIVVIDLVKDWVLHGVSPAHL